jgi:hypothetical protein
MEQNAVTGVIKELESLGVVGATTGDHAQQQEGEEFDGDQLLEACGQAYGTIEGLQEQIEGMAQALDQLKEAITLIGGTLTALMEDGEEGDE